MVRKNRVGRAWRWTRNHKSFTIHHSSSENLGASHFHSSMYVQVLDIFFSVAGCIYVVKYVHLMIGDVRRLYR